MRISEFNALKPGDKIANEISNSVGEVTGVTTSIRGNTVSVVWGPRHDREMPFAYSHEGTVWFNWSKAADNAQAKP